MSEDMSKCVDLMQIGRLVVAKELYNGQRCSFLFEQNVNLIPRRNDARLFLSSFISSIRLPVWLTPKHT